MTDKTAGARPCESRKRDARKRDAKTFSAPLQSSKRCRLVLKINEYVGLLRCGLVANAAQLLKKNEADTMTGQQEHDRVRARGEMETQCWV
jgi:20S proteasome alpha/beta subunit